MRALFYTILILILSTISVYAQERKPRSVEPKPESLKSFIDAVNGIDWKLPPPKDIIGADKPCYPKLKDGFENLNPVALDKTAEDPILDMLTLFTYLNMLIEEGRFQEISVSNIPGLKSGARDQIFRGMQKYREGSPFVDFVKGPGGHLSESDATSLRFALTVYQQIGGTQFYSRNTKAGSCNLTETLFVQRTSIDIPNERVVFKVSRTLVMKCDCDGNPLDVDDGVVVVETELYGNYSGGLDNMKFSAHQPVIWDRLRLRCCEPKVETDEEPADEKDDHGSVPGTSSSSNCCSYDPQDFSVGFFPTIAFDDNFDSSALGLAVEGIYRIGPSFGTNQWYVGVEGEYQTTSSQDGDFTTSGFGIGAFVENRTPIVPCFQWTQRIGGQYTTGTYESFGFENDFNETRFRLDTGFNVDLSESVALGAQVALLEIGSQNIDSGEGEEIKNDIGAFKIGPTQVRFGVRFKFE